VIKKILGQNKNLTSWKYGPGRDADLRRSLWKASSYILRKLVFRSLVLKYVFRTKLLLSNFLTGPNSCVLYLLLITFLWFIFHAVACYYRIFYGRKHLQKHILFILLGSVHEPVVIFMIENFILGDLCCGTYIVENFRMRKFPCWIFKWLQIVN
jgi:hypothetical protein